MILFFIILSLFSLGSPVHTDVARDIYFTWTGERIPCEFVVVEPAKVKLRRLEPELAEEEKFKAKEIQGYRHEGNVIMSKKIVNDADSGFIFLPFRKPHFTYRYEKMKFDGNLVKIDRDEIKDTYLHPFKLKKEDMRYKVVLQSNGKVTFYRLEEFKNEYSSPMMGVGGVPIPVPVDINTKKYRLFIDEDKKGLSEIPFVKLLGKGKSPKVYEILSNYLADNINLVEKIKADSNKTATRENIEEYIEAYFGESLEKIN
jgi:hypothetical protein